jgi:hypothetical protein
MFYVSVYTNKSRLPVSESLCISQIVRIQNMGEECFDENSLENFFLNSL